ncbi:uncharacterized protein I206_100353 [Kwoniella pini CBS 10737]|uniref:Metallo-beta-lactamase domain-containing protein n=1 Tax=Kwoniella pini CBS 10737 TaxID=1296096 RepID=A0A1B9IDP1_9TREE|nr:uncharacterized protein I206_00972 [Kwoniella pini CBS 10737]OCF53666.1 hypothetical protein I206_00972 [Kwoniella pini CBS 10737]
MYAASLYGLKRAVIILPVAWTGAWLGYYAYTDTLRRSHIRDRNRELSNTLMGLPGDGPDFSKPAEEIEREALKKRYSSLNFAGRYWNPYVEWREQGAWEWALWKIIISTITLKLFYNGGVPPERPIPDLPLERPDFSLLFPSTSIKTPSTSPSPTTTREPGSGGSDVPVTDKLTLTWLGQSTSYVTLDNLTILTDPALSDRTLPSRIAPQRLRPSPCELSELKRVDVVLVSHNHFDHLDPEAIIELGDSCEWVVPKGVGPFIRKFGVTRVTELDWWEEKNHTLSRPGQKDKVYTITAVPNMHWSARSPLDTNATLWAAFHVKSHTEKPKSFIHLGDTGYSPTLYHAVGRVLGPIDLAAIPIGSYEPKWHMHLQHTDPEGAVRMALQMKVGKSVGVHWGTWLMSDEAYNKPPLDLEIARQKLDVTEDQFCVLPAGKTIVIE